MLSRDMENYTMRIFKNKRKGLIALALLLAIGLIPAGRAIANFSPVRPTFTWANPANYITFNSITDNPFVGDERTFLDARDATSTVYKDSNPVSDNQEFIVTAYFHNNARSELNLVATNTRARFALPTGPIQNQQIIGFISADNASPGTVSDTTDFTSSQPFTLEYVPGSARLRTNALNDVTLSDSIVTTGAPIGFNAVNGNVPGCAEFSGWVFIRVKVKMQPTVTPAYACTLLDVKTKPNRGVDASVTYTTSGGATFKNVTFNWGDSNSTLTTNTTASHTYGADGNYTINATLRFDVGGTEQTAVCSKAITITTPPVTPPVTPPAALPVTGPASTIAIFAGVSTFAGILHYLWKVRTSRNF